MILDDEFYRIFPPRFIIFFCARWQRNGAKKITLELTPKSDFSQSFGSVVHGLLTPWRLSLLRSLCFSSVPVFSNKKGTTHFSCVIPACPYGFCAIFLLSANGSYHLQTAFSSRCHRTGALLKIIPHPPLFVKSINFEKKKKHRRGL